MKLSLFLLATTFFWGVAAIFDKLALGKTPPLTGLMVRQFILTGALLFLGLATGRLGNIATLEWRTIILFGLSGICGGALGLLDLLSRSPLRRSIARCTHKCYLSFDNRIFELAYSS